MHQWSNLDYSLQWARAVKGVGSRFSFWVDLDQFYIVQMVYENINAIVPTNIFSPFFQNSIPNRRDEADSKIKRIKLYEGLRQ